MAVTLHLISVPENTWTRHERLVGIRDISLTEKGRVQAKEIARQLHGFTFTEMYVGRTTSANQTAKIIQDELCKVEIRQAEKRFKLKESKQSMTRGAYLSLEKRNQLAHIKLYKDNRLNEINFGLLQGLYPEEIETRFGEIWSLYGEKPSQTIFPNGDAVCDIIARVTSFLQSIQRTELFEYHTVLITHPTIVKLITCICTGMPIDTMHQIPCSEGDISVVQYG